MSLRGLWRIPVYALLVTGAAAFSVPFLWMAATSVKVDRELFTKELQIFPSSPRPRKRSPYVDDKYFSDVSGPRFEELLPELRRLAEATGFLPPEDVNRELAWNEIARGLYDKLSKRLPRELWEGPPDKLLAALREQVDRGLVESAFASIERRVCLGSVRVRSQSLVEGTLLGEVPPSKRFSILTPDTAVLSDRSDGNLQYASLAYDFSRGDKVVLSGTFELPFEASSLQRVQLYFKPDDTWHELHFALEMLGRRYVSERPIPLANFDWTTVTWQWPGPDDYSTKIKTWTLLREDAGYKSPVTGERNIRLTFELRRCGWFGAWANKLALNYQRVLDHIPFWRYVRVSLFLVVANVLLTVFASSLVAYSFARLNWPGREFTFLLMLATMMVPGQVTMIPHFLIWKHLGAYNTLTPLWLGSAFGNAFFIFLLRQFMKGIPRDLEDAARIDGCGFLRIYWHIILPLIGPSLAAIAIFTFMGAWNDFMGPLIYLSDQRLYPLAFGLYAFSVQVGNNPALTMAGSFLMTVPVIAIFFLAQRYFIQGVTLTGLKG